MKYVIFADLHLTGKDDDFVSINKKNYPRREYYVIKNITETLEKLDKTFPSQDKNVIIPGDVYHYKSYSHASSQELFKNLLSSFPKWNFFILIKDSSENIFEMDEFAAIRIHWCCCAHDQIQYMFLKHR